MAISSLPTKREKKVAKVLSKLQFELVAIGRFAGIQNSSFHVVTDASEKTYTAAAYLHTEQEGKVKISLLFSKLRIKPIKCISIQRMELTAILIRVWVIIFATQQLHNIEAQCFPWSDSRCATGWTYTSKHEKLP